LAKSRTFSEIQRPQTCVTAVRHLDSERVSPTPRPDSKSAAIADFARRAALVAADNKANDVVVLGLKGVSDMTDFFVIASGTSDTHVRALGEHIQEELRKDGMRAHHVEGMQQGRWVLLDYVDFVVHLFHPSLRNFYQLERLWSDAHVMPVTAQSASGS
jgi:ribosome-associated protein